MLMVISRFLVHSLTSTSRGFYVK